MAYSLIFVARHRALEVCATHSKLLLHNELCYAHELTVLRKDKSSVTQPRIATMLAPTRMIISERPTTSTTSRALAYAALVEKANKLAALKRAEEGNRTLLNDTHVEGLLHEIKEFCEGHDERMAAVFEPRAADMCDTSKALDGKLFELQRDLARLG